MKWKQLPIGEFIKAKQLINKVGEIIAPLYEGALPEDPAAVISEAQAVWSAFLTMAHEGEPDASITDVSHVSLAGLKGAMRSFFLEQVGPAQK